MKPTPAPYVKARRAPRPHGIVGSQVRDLKTYGDIWLANRNGIVIYGNEDLPLDDGRRLQLVPRDINLERIPGLWPPPAEFTQHGAPGVWRPIDWLRDPRRLVGDPFVARIMFLRRNFYELKRGHRSGRWRAYDIWPQVHAGQGPIWPYEAKARLPSG